MLAQHRSYIERDSNCVGLTWYISKGLIIRSPHSLPHLWSGWELQPQKNVLVEEEATPLPSKESDSDESYEATQEDATVFQGDIEIAVRVPQASKAFTGQCFRCNKVRLQFHDEECEMYDPEC